MADDEYLRARLAARFWGGFYRCPNTGRILEALPGDDKVVCFCGRSNPKAPHECTERTATHTIKFLQEVSLQDYLAFKGHVQ